MLPINADRLNRTKLLFLQGKWLEQCYNKVLEGKEGEISCPFSLGVSTAYVESPKTVMIIGQEANSHTCDYKKWNLENMQKWAISYLERQLGIENDYTLDGKKLKRNPSAFWRFFNAFKDCGYFPCWNNLEKVRRYQNGKEYRLTLDDEGYGQRKILNEKFKNGKSLLQNEIELLKPDIVVFAIGPNNPYLRALGYAFGVDESLLHSNRPTPENYCRKVSQILGLDMPAYWTYHPSFLSRKKLLENAVETILKSSSQP